MAAGVLSVSASPALLSQNEEAGRSFHALRRRSRMPGARALRMRARCFWLATGHKSRKPLRLGCVWPSSRSAAGAGASSPPRAAPAALACLLSLNRCMCGQPPTRRRAALLAYVGGSHTQPTVSVSLHARIVSSAPPPAAPGADAPFAPRSRLISGLAVRDNEAIAGPCDCGMKQVSITEQSRRAGPVECRWAAEVGSPAGGDRAGEGRTALSMPHMAANSSSRLQSVTRPTATYGATCRETNPSMGVSKRASEQNGSRRHRRRGSGHPGTNRAKSKRTASSRSTRTSCLDDDSAGAAALALRGGSGSSSALPLAACPRNGGEGSERVESLRVAVLCRCDSTGRDAAATTTADTTSQESVAEMESGRLTAGKTCCAPPEAGSCACWPCSPRSLPRTPRPPP